ncbi:hypothetical protein CRM22_004411 [Opisthorchis felineus]|uniref:Uncharacterized protein n=1 Tax=Opisthorchis felineus TaxID=147828 RepID=A0A4S2LW97_OPIFE|nr:hypothetical protein CRM22_004411 [Opisthorchis felineus]
MRTQRNVCHEISNTFSQLVYKLALSSIRNTSLFMSIKYGFSQVLSIEIIWQAFRTSNRFLFGNPRVISANCSRLTRQSSALIFFTTWMAKPVGHGRRPKTRPAYGQRQVYTRQPCLSSTHIRSAEQHLTYRFTAPSREQLLRRSKYNPVYPCKLSCCLTLQLLLQALGV